MNPFTAVAAILNLGASCWHLYHGEWKMAVVWFSYAIATGMLSMLKDN